MTKLVDLEIKPELEPCPFCGEIKELGVYTNREFKSQFRAECHNCGALGASRYSIIEAAAAWNRRAPVTSQEMPF